MPIDLLSQVEKTDYRIQLNYWNYTETICNEVTENNDINGFSRFDSKFGCP